MINVIETLFPSIPKEEYEKCIQFIKTKCSQFYFSEYLSLTNGNVDDAISFFKFDEKFRSLLLQYVLRFENQIKSDFATEIELKTGSSSFWSNGDFYLESAKVRKADGKSSDFTYLRRRITEWIHHSGMDTPKGCSNYVAVHSCSFGSFVDLIKYIDICHKKEFIERYTSFIPSLKDDYNLSFKTFISYLTCIKKLRDRCAHGGHVITKTFTKLFAPHNRLLNDELKPDSSKDFSMFELILNYLGNYSNCKTEMKKRIKTLLEKYNDLLIKYEHSHSLTRDTLKKLF